jgi:type VI protein secretion system component Hcp
MYGLVPFPFFNTTKMNFMKRVFLFAFLLLAAIYSHAQVSVYAKFVTNQSPQLVDENPGTAHSGQILLTTIGNGERQTLNLSSQSTGVGAGKIQFDSIEFTKPISVNTPTFFSMMAAGTPFKYVEISYYNAADQIIFRQTLGLVPVNTMYRAAASCTSGCPGIVETISLQYGTEILTYYTTPGNLSTGISKGWNRINNTAVNDPSTITN